MSCFHPLKAFKIGFNYDTKKPIYKVTGYDVNYVVKGKNGDWYPAYDFINNDKDRDISSEFIEVPCRHCVGCMLDRSRDWATRCMLEASYHEHNCFITLTYNDDHLPAKREIIDTDGVIAKSPYNSLQKKDFQNFMKRLRKHLEPLKIRFFACGEYGSKTFRPHYHAIIFGYDFPDKVFLKSNFRGDKYYISKELQDAWSDPNDHKPIGNILVTDISFDTCAYVARYCLKKSDNDMSAFYKIFNVDPEFTLMSRKPGIGRDYYEENKDKIYEDGRIILSDIKGVKILRPPKYYDKLYDIDSPLEFEEIKEQRFEYMNNKKQMELDGTDLDYISYLKVKESKLRDKTKILKERSRNETSISF